LVGLDQHPHVHYRAAFVRILSDHPLYPQFSGKLFSTRDPFRRSSAYGTVRLLDEEIKNGSSEDKLLFDAWDRTELADEAAPISPELALTELGWNDVDFVKIDIDCGGFEVLTSLSDWLPRWKVLGATLAVNLFGGVYPTDSTFHKTDRLMRSKGFTLVGLEPRTDSMSPCPEAMQSPSLRRHIQGARSKATRTS